MGDTIAYFITLLLEIGVRVIGTIFMLGIACVIVFLLAFCLIGAWQIATTPVFINK